MAIKKRSRVSAEFNMSSLTDIIFLLLIFFMLTSSVVTPNALNLKMPGRANSPAVPNTSELDEVRVDARGAYYFNSRSISLEELQARLGGVRPGYRIILAPSREAPIEAVTEVMELARINDIEAILAAS